MPLAINLKESLHQLADQLPDDATWDDVMEKIHFRQAVEKGIKAADEGKFVSAEDLESTFSRWDVDASR